MWEPLAIDHWSLRKASVSSRQGHARVDTCGCSSVVEHLLAKERVESSNLFIRLIQNPVQKGLLRVSLH